MPSESIKESIWLGNYQIDKSIISVSANTHLIPNYTQLQSFTYSQMQQFFRYIGNGWFYSEVVRNNNYIINSNFGTNVNGDLPHNERRKLFDQCTPGDMRVKFYFSKPSEITVIGHRNENRIVSKDYKGFSIGSAVEGKVSLNELLGSHVSGRLVFSWIMRIVFLISIITTASVVKSSGVFVYILSYGLLLISKNMKFFTGNIKTGGSAFLFGMIYALVSSVLFLFFDSDKNEPHQHQN